MGNLSSVRLFAIGSLAIATAATCRPANAAQRQSAKQEKQATATQEPSTLAISIPWQWLASTGGTMNVQCDASRPANDDGVKMVEALPRAGRQGRYAGKGSDGGMFTGTRNGDDFTFHAINKDGSKFVMQMPWLARHGQSSG